MFEKIRKMKNKKGFTLVEPSGRRARLRPQQTFRVIPPPSPRREKASLVKGRCRSCEAEGFLPVCGCDSVQGIARRNPSGRLRRPPAPLLALRATSPRHGGVCL